MITTFEKLPEIREKHQEERIVFAGGCFDLVHEGHVLGMQRCKSFGDVLVVGISSDKRVQERKGPGRPFRSELGRLAVVDEFRSVDYTFIMPMPIPNGDTPTIQVIRTLEPEVFADNIENRERWLPVQPLIESLGTKLMFNDFPRLESTTTIAGRVALYHTLPDTEPPQASQGVILQ